MSQEKAVKDTNVVGDIMEKCIADLYESNAAMRTFQTKQKAKIKELEKLVIKQQKQLSNKKKPKSDKKRKPSGFAKPTEISNELCNFLEKPEGTIMARTEVGKYLSKYIKENNLQLPEDKRVIVPDEKLNKLLSSTDGEKLTYFNLQKYITHHFASAKNNTQSAQI